MRSSSGVYSDGGVYCGEAVAIKDELKAMSNYRAVKYHEVFDEPISKWAEEARKAFDGQKYVAKSVDEALNKLEEVYSTTKRVMWECPHTNDCDVHNCLHYGPHEYIEEDCATGELCSFGIVPDNCVRVGGPKHKEIFEPKDDSEGKCVDIW